VHKKEKGKLFKVTKQRSNRCQVSQANGENAKGQKEEGNFHKDQRVVSAGHKQDSFWRSIDSANGRKY
jgi:hypothetical protein